MINIRIRDLPEDTQAKLDAIAERRNSPKWEVIRDAIVEFVERHGNG